jgi:CRISPR-associated protein Csx10
MSELTLTLSQPAQLGDRARKDYVLSTLEYVPGSVVRGAFAAAWLARNGASQPGTPRRAEFLGLFEGGVRFGALLREGTELLREGTEFMSLAVVGHKYDPTDACGYADYDRAMGDEPPPYCPDCGSPLEQLKGLHGARPDLGRRTSTAIGEAGVAVDRALFTRETLKAGQAFRGTIVAGEDLRAILAGLGPVRIGGRRTTHGLAQVSIRDGGPPPTAQRRPDGMLVVRLRSPGIFTDACGRPARHPSAEELEDALGVPARVVKSWTRWEQAGGWHAASGLPKPQELAVCAGSTFLIHPERAVDDSALANLGARGLGLRRHEGFGDLAPPPALRPGRIARDAEARRIRELTDSAAPLRRIQTRPRAWQKMLELMTAHAAGDTGATEALRRLGSGHPDADVHAAMDFFLGLPPQDAARVSEVLGR